MPVTPTYPGVYVVEIPSEVRTIVGVSTSVTAFVGYTQRGLTNEAVRIFNFGDYERQFGGLSRDSDVSYAVQQFFQNGGTEAWIVRVAQGAQRAGISLLDTDGNIVLEVAAASEGIWGNNLRIAVDYDTANPASLFNLTVTEYVERNGNIQVQRSETHRNLSMDSFSPTYAVDVLDAGSELIRLTRPDAALAPIANIPGTSTSGDLSNFDFSLLNDDRRRLAITVNGDRPHEIDLLTEGPIGGLNALAGRIQDAVQDLFPGVTAFANFECTVDGNTIRATSGERGEHSSVRFSNASQRNAAAILRLGTANGGVEADAVALIRPVQTGTVSADLSNLDFATLPVSASIDVTIEVTGSPDGGTHTLNLWTQATEQPTSLEELRSLLNEALNEQTPLALRNASVTLNSNRLRVVAGGNQPNLSLSFADGGVADTISLSNAGGATVNVAQYALGLGATLPFQSTPIPGSDGQPPTATELRGSRANKTGLYALEDVDIFNILCIPNVSDPVVLSEAIAYCKEQRAFLIIDLPDTVNTVPQAEQWLNNNVLLRDENAAAYFPRIMAADPLQNFRLRSFAPSGAIAGLYARTDSERGVWKAPAGTEAVLRGAQGLSYKLTDRENGVLNPLGLNCLRQFPVYGNVVWGARTLRGADQSTSEWKYIPVRRLALFLEESLYRGTQWVVFEPNDEPLWAAIRLNVGAFMSNLFRQGAFQGRSAREAYLVKCDSETTTQNDINLGIVNIIVGFAPLKPAEFVILQIQQLAGQIAT